VILSHKTLLTARRINVTVADTYNCRMLDWIFRYIDISESELHMDCSSTRLGRLWVWRSRTVVCHFVLRDQSVIFFCLNTDVEFLIINVLLDYLLFDAISDSSRKSVIE